MERHPSIIRRYGSSFESMLKSNLTSPEILNHVPQRSKLAANVQACLTRHLEVDDMMSIVPRLSRFDDEAIQEEIQGHSIVSAFGRTNETVSAVVASVRSESDRTGESARSIMRRSIEASKEEAQLQLPIE